MERGPPCLKPSKGEGPCYHDWFLSHYLSQSSRTHVCAFIPAPAARVVSSCHLCPVLINRIHTDVSPCGGLEDSHCHHFREIGRDLVTRILTTWHRPCVTPTPARSPF